MLGKGYLCAVVTQDAWQTPTTNMDMVRSEDGVQKRIAFRASIGRKSIPDGNLGEQMQRLHGQAAPANPSTDGSRQGLWATPRAGCPGSRAPGTGGKVLEEQVKGGNWATPQAHDAQGPKTPEQIEAMRAKGHGVKNLNEMVTWPTPSASCDQGGPSGLAGGSGNRKKLNSMLSREEAKAMGCGKLNPRWVETLQGVCMGWTSPSCPASVIKNWPKFVSGWCAVTIEPTNFASSATESCLPQPKELFEF
jgi:hypothetical protein